MNAPLHGLELLRIASEVISSRNTKSDSPAPKKRGRKPTPGMTEEDRRQARLLKNRRTAEISRRRKLIYLQNLRSERDDAVAECERLRADNSRLRAMLASRGLFPDSER